MPVKSRKPAPNAEGYLTRKSTTAASAARIITACRTTPEVWCHETARCPDHLHPEHWAKLLDSNLTLDTILLAGFYTEYCTDRLRKILGGIKVRAPGLVIPGFGLTGERNGYDIVRMFPPHVFPDGREAKYLAPLGREREPYVPPMPVVWDSLLTSGALLGSAESVFKALASSQAGVPCIGLNGINGWSATREHEGSRRRMNSDLADIDWEGRPAPILFDTDPERNPDVNRESAEYARNLADRGADPRPLFPPLRRDGAGLFVKQAPDDYLKWLCQSAKSLEVGQAKYRKWVFGSCTTPPIAELGEVRRLMLREREGALDALGRRRYDRLNGDPVEPGETLLDNSPTGSGKSHSDFGSIKAQEEKTAMRTFQPGKLGEWARNAVSVPRSLTLVPTHAHCDEARMSAARQGLAVVAYPKLGDDTCLNHAEASAVMGRGLVFQKVICPGCELRDVCLYRQQWLAAERSRHAVATHARGVCTMTKMAAKRDLITLHEVPLDVIRPTFSARNGLRRVAEVAGQADDDATDAKERGFYRHMERVARLLNGWLKGADKSELIDLPASLPEPEGCQKALNDAILELGSGAPPPAEAMQLVLAAASGALAYVGVAVDVRDGKDGKPKIHRKLIGSFKTDLPPGSWISDATADRGEIETALGHPVRVVSPSGRLFLHHQVVQIIPRRLFKGRLVEQDVTIGREAATVADQVRGFLHDLPYRHLGLLTHKKLAERLPGLLGEPYRSWLAMVEYFHGGFSRGSNAWLERCDAVIVLGTPRVPAHAVRDHLYRLGKIAAWMMTAEEAGWGKDYWSGVTESGGRVTVRTPHYRDHDWHAAYCSLVRSELVQAVGRGRGILPEGIPVYVVTTENLAPPSDDDGRNGLPLADHPFPPLTEAQAKVLACFTSPRPATTREIAEALGVSKRRAYELIAELVRDKRVRKVGETRGRGAGGWQALAVDA